MHLNIHRPVYNFISLSVFWRIKMLYSTVRQVSVTKREQSNLILPPITVVSGTDKRKS